jgi:rhomboid protease GluP
LNNKRAILCPNCNKLVSADEPRCPYCGHSGPGAWWKGLFPRRGLNNADNIIRVFIYVNAGMYILSLLLSTRSIGMSWNPLRALSPDDTSIMLLGATGTIPIGQYNRWWTLVSANYLHGSLLHIIFNMMAFKQLAPFIIREFGAYRLIILYTLGGVFGFWLSYVARVHLTIGASAAVCALIGATLYYGKSRGGAYGQAVYKQVSGWVMGIFIFGLLIPGINNWGHGGGILAGIGLGYLLGYQEKRPEGFGHKLLASALVLLTVAILLWAVGTSIYLRMTVDFRPPGFG